MMCGMWGLRVMWVIVGVLDCLLSGCCLCLMSRPALRGAELCSELCIARSGALRRSPGPNLIGKIWTRLWPAGSVESRFAGGMRLEWWIDRLLDCWIVGFVGFVVLLYWWICGLLDCLIVGFAELLACCFVFMCGFKHCATEVLSNVWNKP